MLPTVNETTRMEKGSPRIRGRAWGGGAVAVLLPGGLSDFGLVSDGRPGPQAGGPGGGAALSWVH